jgi:hypothetical protein
MINMVTSLLLFLLFKLGFLRVFGTNGEHYQRVVSTPSGGEHDADVVETHDRRSVGSNLRSELHSLSAGEKTSSSFALLATEQIMEGR